MRDRFISIIEATFLLVGLPRDFLIHYQLVTRATSSRVLLHPLLLSHGCSSELYQAKEWQQTFLARTLLTNSVIQA